MKEVPLKFEELHPGMEVEDWWTEPCVIRECSDIHNVIVDFPNGGTDMYCLDGDCDDRDVTPLYKRNDYGKS